MIRTTWGPKSIPSPAWTTCLEIDLQQIKKNYNLLCKMSSKKCGAVVKSDGYGLGAIPISKVLHEEGCRHFFVNSIDEGIDLRNGGAFSEDTNIYVFNGVLDKTESLLDYYKLVPALLSLEQIERWRQFAITHAKKVDAVIHIDTGMSRLGLCEEEQKTLYATPNLLEHFNICFIMSHLACSNEPHNPLNLRQLKKFSHFIKYFPGHSYSLSASIGIMLGSEYHFDLTRPGFGIYGETKLLPNSYSSVRLWVKIIQIRSVKQGSYVGYGANYQCITPKRLAILNIGFADTWIQPKDQHVGLSLFGQEIKLIGISSMNLLIADITSFPEGTVRVGDWVELLGTNMPLCRAAEISGTSPAKILTSLVKLKQYRVYHT